MPNPPRIAPGVAGRPLFGGFVGPGSAIAPPPPRSPVARVPAVVEPPIPREPPAGLGDSKAVAEWIVGAIQAHEDLRTRSFYDTGHLIARLLELRDVFAVADIKELCAKVDLGLSHMTAQKYLRVAQTFPRDVALRHGVEKCYALVVYSKAIGRPHAAAAILAADELVRGAERGARVSDLSAAKLYAAVRALKERARAEREPTEQRVAAERAAASAQKLLRSIGVRGAHAAIVRRGGSARVAVYIPIDVAAALETALPKAVARFGLRLAKTQPDLFEPLRAAGWKIRPGAS